MMKSFRCLLQFAAAVITLTAGFLPTGEASAQVQAELLRVDGGTASDGNAQRVALKLIHAPGWHTYWSNPGTGQPTTIDWRLPSGWRAGGISWPVPVVIRGSNGQPTGHGYDRTVYLPVLLKRPSGASPDGAAQISAKVKWLMCEAERCIPGGADLTLELGPGTRSDPAVVSALAKQAMPFQDPAVRTDVSLEGAKVNLKITGMGPMRDPHFFPATPMVWHSSEQKFAKFNDGVSVSLPIDDYWEGATDHLSGVLAFTDREGRYQGVVVDTPIEGGTAAGASAAASSPRNPSAYDLPMLLLFAFLGGLILNLMPCVLPVLSIKALGLAQGAAGDARREGLHYAAGVMATFMLVGGFMLILRSTLGGIGWGFQLQNPYVVLALALLMIGIGFNLAGLFEIGAGAGGIGQGLIDRAGKARSFLTGALAVIVATPCTAPFMAAALGAALVASAPFALSIFLVMGLGMAAPFLLLAFWPSTRSILPKPGAWMATFKTLLSFPMFATAIWLLWVLGSQRGLDAMALGLVAAVALALALWSYSKAHQGRLRWHMVMIFALGLIGGSVWMISQRALPTETRNGTEASYPEVAYTPSALDAALASGQPVFAYFTADWCVTCKLNERVALHRQETAKLFAKKNVRVLVGDWTNQNSQITAILAEYGRAGVPLYIYFPSGADVSEGRVLPQILTPDVIAQHLK